MSNLEALKTNLTNAPKTTDLKSLIEKSVKELGRALPEHLRPERLVRIALTLIRTTPELAKCTPESFLGALFVSAQLGVEPVAGQAYILPFNNKRKIGDEWKTVKEAQFILGYRGLASLFYRHEKAVQISWGVVHEKDDFKYEYGTNANLFHRPAPKERGPVIGYYVISVLDGGGKPFMYMSREDCLAHGKKHSKTFDRKAGKFYDNSPWNTSEDAMCLKTCLIQLGKLLPLSVEIHRAISADETSRNYKSGIDDALDITPTTNWDDDTKKGAIEPDPVSVLPKEIKILDYGYAMNGKEISVSQTGEDATVWISVNAGAVALIKAADEKRKPLLIRYFGDESPFEIDHVQVAE